MNKDSAKDIGFADQGLFEDPTLDFDGYLNDDTMQDASHFTPINDPSASMTTLPDTVSPADLIYNDFTAPNSNSFTNLTTPSMLDDNSPFLTDSVNVSPAFELGDFNAGSSGDSLAPLFPGNEFDYLGSGVTRKNVELSAESLARTTSAMPMSRSTSNNSFEGTPSSNSKADIRHRLSIGAGISKPSRRTTKDLGPIDVDKSDERAVKRAKNTMAARKSRQKKKDEVDHLETKLIEMVEERDYWKMMAVRYGAPVPE